LFISGVGTDRLSTSSLEGEEEEREIKEILPAGAEGAG
jgi:hypothetical protein